MRTLFEKLKGLNFEDGAKIIRTAIPNVREQMTEIDETACDFDFKFNEDDYFHYTTKMEKVEDDAPVVDTENGYWGLMFEGNHLTHVIEKTLLQEIEDMGKNICVTCGKELVSNYMINELLGLDLKSDDDTMMCGDCRLAQSRQNTRQELINDLSIKFGSQDADKIINACLWFINNHSGNNLDGLTHEAKWMQIFINDYMSIKLPKPMKEV